MTIPVGKSKGSEPHVTPSSTGFYKIDSIRIKGIPYKMRIYGDYLYLASSKGIYIIDIKIPENPKIISHFCIRNKIWDVIVRGKYLFAADYKNGIFLFDCSNLNFPKQALYLKKNFYRPILSLQDSVLYILEYNGPLHIFSIKDSDLKEISTIITGEYNIDMKIYNNFLFISNLMGGLGVWDISNPKEIKKFPIF